jgi:hypothetical protein
MNLATVGVLHVAMALEDPFDNQGLDGIYVDEALFEAEQVHVVSCAISVCCDRAWNEVPCYMAASCGLVQARLPAPGLQPQGQGTYFVESVVEVIV